MTDAMDVFLAELWRLAQLIRETLSEKWMLCVFLAGLPGQVRQHLWEALRMNNIYLCKFLTRAQAIMSDEKEPVEVTAQPFKSNTGPTSSSTSFSHSHKCSGLSHSARHCQYQYV